MIKIKPVFYAVLATLPLLPALAKAETNPYDFLDKTMIESDKNKPTKKVDEWQTTIGLGFGYGSIYQGAAKQEFYFLPVIEASYGNWGIGFSGINYSFINTDEWQVGAGIGYDFGRKDKYLPKRYRGLGDVDGGLTTNIFANYQALDWLGFSLDVTKSQADSKSLLVTAGMRADFPLYGESLMGNIGLNAVWANDDHMQSYYGVNAAQSAKTRLKRFNAKSGLEKLDFSTGITYLIDKKWTYTAAVGVEAYQGDAKDSPVIEDKTQPYFFNTISYTF